MEEDHSSQRSRLLSAAAGGEICIYSASVEHYIFDHEISGPFAIANNCFPLTQFY